MSAPSNGSGASVLVLIVLVAVIVAPTPAKPSHSSQPSSPARSGVFLEVHPSSIQPGFKVDLRAGCDRDATSATVRSRAFGEVTLAPQHSGRLLTGAATVPHSTAPGTYRVDLHCPSGATAAADLVVLGGARPTRGPDTGGGGGAGDQPQTAAPLVLAGAGMAALALGGLLFARRRRQAG